MSNTLEHPCAVCRRQVAHGYLMCFEHWKLVPAEQQRAVWRTWRRYQGVHSMGRAYMAGLRSDYEKARDAAITTVRALLNPAAAAATTTIGEPS